VVAKESGATLIVLATSTGEEITSLMHDAAIDEVAFDPTGRFVATRGGRTGVVDLEAQSDVPGLEADAVQWFSARTGDDVAHILAAPAVARLRDHLGDVVAVSGDRRWLAASERGPAEKSGAFDVAACRVLLVDLTNGIVVGRIEHKDAIACLAFSPDGTWLAAASVDGALRCWLARPDLLMSTTASRFTTRLSREDWQLYLGDEPYTPCLAPPHERTMLN
jgi:WD40 repeat protein